MTEPDARESRLRRLALFLIAISLAGLIIAGMHYLAIDLPRQQARTPDPAGAEANMTAYTQCTGGCISTNVVYMSPAGPQNPTDDACVQRCRDRYLRP